MTAPNPLAAPDAWNPVADAYVAELVPIFSLYARDALALAAPSASARVLDVATGPGTLALIAATQVAHVAAIDFAEEMVERFRRRCAPLDIANVAVSVGDGQVLPFADASFECAFSIFGLIFFPDRAAGFSELRRAVAHPGRRGRPAARVRRSRRLLDDGVNRLAQNDGIDAFVVRGLADLHPAATARVDAEAVEDGGSRRPLRDHLIDGEVAVQLEGLCAHEIDQ